MDFVCSVLPAADSFRLVYSIRPGAFLSDLPGRHCRHQSDSRRPDGDAAAAVGRVLLHALEASHRPAPDTGAKRTIAVKKLSLSAVFGNCPVIDIPIIWFVIGCFRPTGTVFGINGAIQGIEGGALHLLQIPLISRDLVYPGQKLHPGHRDTGFQHQPVILCACLHQGRMVKKLMAAA